MNHPNKVSSKYILASLIALLFIVLTAESKDKTSYQNAFHNLLTSFQDTTKPVKNKPHLLKTKQPKKDTTVLQKKDILPLNKSDTIPPKIKKTNNTDTSIITSD